MSSNFTKIRLARDFFPVNLQWNTRESMLLYFLWKNYYFLQNLSFLQFFYQGFLSRTLMIHMTGREGRGYSLFFFFKRSEIYLQHCIWNKTVLVLYIFGNINGNYQHSNPFNFVSDIFVNFFWWYNYGGNLSFLFEIEVNHEVIWSWNKKHWFPDQIISSWVEDNFWW